MLLIRKCTTRILPCLLALIVLFAATRAFAHPHHAGVPAVYCTPPTSSCASNAHISRVVFGSLDNSSACSPNGYGDHTALAAPAIPAGKTTTITITKASVTSGDVAIWIDLDQNGSFETSEYFFISNSTTAVVSASIFLPSATPGGTTRMRVRRRVSGTLPASASCLAMATGETEDYTLQIIPAPVVITPLPLPTADTLYNPSITLRAHIRQPDAGIDQTPANSPRLWARRVGGITWRQFPGTLVSGTANNGNWDFTLVHDSLGIRFNDCDSVQYYFVAQDLNNPFNLGYSPEVGAAHNSVQVQVSPPNNLYGYRLKSRLRDVIYVSNSGCQFRSLSNQGGVFHRINSDGLKGDLVVYIESNLSETGDHELDGTKLNGFSLSIRPYTARPYHISLAASSNQMIRLNGAKKVLIDGSFNGNGRYLQFRTPQPGYHLDSLSNIRIYNNCDSVLIMNCVFENQPYGALYFGESSIRLAGGTNRNIAIYNNLFRHQTETGVWPARHILSTGQNDSIIIRKNEISNNSEHAIKVASGNKWLIDSNHFYRSAPMGPYGGNYTAVWVSGGGHKIRNNNIGGSAAFAGGAAMSFLNNPSAGITGIDVQSTAAADSVIIEQNRIDNINISTNTIISYAAAFTGINIFNNRAAIRNNIIGSSTGSNYTISVAAPNITGIKTMGAQGVLIEYNTIRNITTGNTNGMVNLNVEMAGISASAGSAGKTIIRENLVARLRNLFNANSSNSTQVTGTLGIANSGAANIEHNTVHDLVASENKMAGIALYNATQGQASMVHRNRVYNLVNQSTFVSIPTDDWNHGIINGIVIENSSVELDVKNNQVTIINNNINSPVNIRGIFAYSSFGASQKFRVLNNSVYIGGNASNHGGSAALAIFAKHIDSLHNNILFNVRQGSDGGHHAIRIHSASTASLMAGTKANFNLYYVPDTAVFAQYGAWGPKLKWTEWKNEFGIDDSSRLVFPFLGQTGELFIDLVNGNLNINSAQSSAWLVNNRGRAIYNLADDLDSINVRSTANGDFIDVGADEFSSYALPPSAVCANSTAGFTSNISGASYQWQVNTGSGFANISNNSQYNGVNTPSLEILNTPLTWDGYRYRVLVGAVVSDTFVLNVVPSVTAAVSISGPSTICAGSGAVFTATPVNGGASPHYQWMVNNVQAGGNSASFQASGLAAGDQVKLLMTSSFSCALPSTVQSNVITINDTASVTANAGPDVQLCAGQSVTIGTAALPGHSYSWSPSAGLSAANLAQPQASPATTTSYVLTVTNSNGCQKRDTVVVSVVSVPAPVITQNGNVLSSSAATGNQWYLDGTAITGANASTYTATTSGTYTARVIFLGCTSPFSNSIVLSITSVGVVPEDEFVVGPNPVTQQLRVHYPAGLRHMQLSITDANGRIVFERMGMEGRTVWVDMHQLPAGLFFVQLRNIHTGKTVRRMVVKM